MQLAAARDRGVKRAKKVAGSVTTRTGCGLDRVHATTSRRAICSSRLLSMRWLFVLVAAVAACGDALDAAALRDPMSCQGCHPDHVREWAGSMHAYASEDPVFVAMNQRGQRDTNGALGDFCVRCHAPLAVALGRTADGLNLASLPRELRGVGCIACHQIEAVDALHNGSLRWAEDGSMRGGIRAPVATPAHDSQHSDLVDGDERASSDACGACHDVVLPSGVSIERTYAEWSSSIFSRPATHVSCASCHMFQRRGPAAIGGPVRDLHDHSLPGVDLALTAWPDRDIQRSLVERDLAGAITSKLCVEPIGGGVLAEVTLDNVQVGHAFPSGVTHARRVWLELVSERDGVVIQTIGSYAPGATIRAADDPSVWILGSRFYDDEGREVQFAWETTKIVSELLSPTVTLSPEEPGYFHARTRSWQLFGGPDLVRIAVHVQPVGLDIIDDLIASGDLDPAVRDAMPVLTIAGAARTWRAADGYGCTD
jgi:hypothetical protein